jgi:hypothetical protein
LIAGWADEHGFQRAAGLLLKISRDRLDAAGRLPCVLDRGRCGSQGYGIRVPLKVRLGVFRPAATLAALPAGYTTANLLAAHTTFVGGHALID